MQVDGVYDPVVGDADDDGDDDILWYAPGTAADEVWEATGINTFVEHPLDLDNTQVPLAGEFDGAFGDALFYGPGTQPDQWMLHQAGITAFAQQDTVVNGIYSRAFTGDFTGEGFTDVFWYQPGTGRDNLWFID
jgi:hypothetical protein